LNRPRGGKKKGKETKNEKKKPKSRRGICVVHRAGTGKKGKKQLVFLPCR